MAHKQWCEEHHEAIIEMSRDIKWLVKDSKDRNHKFEKHIDESDDFRHQVTRNTAWRHAFKWMGAGIVGAIAWIFKLHWGE